MCTVHWNVYYIMCTIMWSVVYLMYYIMWSVVYLMYQAINRSPHIDRSTPGVGQYLIYCDPERVQGSKQELKYIRVSKHRKGNLKGALSQIPRELCPSN